MKMQKQADTKPTRCKQQASLPCTHPCGEQTKATFHTLASSGALEQGKAARVRS